MQLKIINDSDLQYNFIVHMNVDGAGHWCVIGDIINNSNVSNQNIVLDIAEFNKDYDNNAIIITKDSNLNIDNLSATLLSSLECEKITGDGKIKPIINIVKKVYKWLKKHHHRVPPMPPVDDFINVNITRR